MSKGVSTLSLTRGGTPLLTVPLAMGAIESTSYAEPVEESQQYGFEVENREADVEYMLSIGDFSPVGFEIGQARGRHVFWNDGLHFEGAQGRVVVLLRSRKQDSKDIWTSRASFVLYVNPTKLNDQRYLVMQEQMRRLAAGIIFDLVAKATRSVDVGLSLVGVTSRSSQLELAAIWRVWKVVSSALDAISRQPITGLLARYERRLCWGAEQFASNSFAQFAIEGVNPSKSGTKVPFVGKCRVVRETTDVAEHRVIAGALEFLQDRVDECAKSIQMHVDAIEADRPMRDKHFSGQPSLYEENDLPRLARLGDARQRARSLRAELNSARRLPFLRHVRPVLAFPNSPAFRYLAPYYVFRCAIEKYLNESMIVLEAGDDMRIKATQRLYEQWVYVQIASALKACGLRCNAQSGLLGQRTRYRYTLDIDRGTTLRFEDAAGHVVILRYEPWIYSESTAKQRRDSSVFQGESEDMAWSPDILLEFHSVSQSASVLDQVVVVDAKYSHAIGDRHWADTMKYLQIRSIADGRQVVRQLWLAHPGDTGDGIRFRDSSVRWTFEGPSRPISETMLGILELMPADALVQDDASTIDGWVGEPNPIVLEYISGILRYYQYPLSRHGIA